MPERVIVTGAASGIGHAVATRLEGAGSEVVRLDRSPGDGVIDFDVTSSAAWDALEAEGVTGLVHAAGVRERASLADTTEERFRTTIDVNVVGTFLALRWVAQAATARRQGLAVVTMSSGVTTRAVSGQAAYNASKAAVESLTRSAAIELAPLGVRVNAVAPGSIHTPMTAEGWSDDEHAARMRAEIPLARPGDPADVASVVDLLLSDESSYVTGAVWAVDGGWTT